VASSQRPLELILARNMLSSLSTPGVLVTYDADIVFYNEAAGALLGRRFEDVGPLPVSEWMEIFGPRDEDGEPVPFERQPLLAPLRAGRPAHARVLIGAADGANHQIEASGLPIIGSDGFQGALIFFWPVQGEEAA
jgi:PAS domain-containing protein